MHASVSVLTNSTVDVVSALERLWAPDFRSRAKVGDGLLSDS